MTKSAIKLTRKVRNGFSDYSTGDKRGYYYSTKGHAVNRFDAYLQDCDLCLDRDDLSGFDDDYGRKVIAVVDEFGHCAGYACFTWYKMESGRYEFIGYVS